MPGPSVYDVAEMLEGHHRLRKLASSPAHVVPGHDPLILQRYPVAKRGLETIAVRLDADPAS